MIRLFYGLFVFLLTSFLFWLGGFNFDARGSGAVFWLTVSLFLSGMTMTYPGELPGEKEKP